MGIRELVGKWFELWESGDFQQLPLTEDFVHHSPYGVISGKETYLELIQANRDKFLGHRFEIHDQIFEDEKACIRYTAVQGDFRLEVSEWHFGEQGLLAKVAAYYNIEGEISQERQLEFPEES